MSIDLVMAGNLLVDDLVFPDGRTRIGEAGGAMLYSALGAALWDVNVGIASVAGNDYPTSVLTALESRGVDLSGVRRLDHPGLRTWLLYEREGRRVVHHLGCPSHAEVSPSPDHIPAAYHSARAFHLAPMPFEHQQLLLRHLAARGSALLSLDPFEPVRDDNLKSWRETLSTVDAFFLGEDDLELADAGADPRTVLDRLGAHHPKFAAFKRGNRGGVLYDRQNNRFLEWPGARPPVVDVTGAGDAFAGGFLAGWIVTEKVEVALEQGAISASFAIENWGARGLFAASHDQAERRRKVWFGARAVS